MSGKGDKRRPTDSAKFNENYERIFGKKELLTDAAPAKPLTTELISNEDVENYIIHLKERLSKEQLIDADGTFKKFTDCLNIPDGFLDKSQKVDTNSKESNDT